MDFNFRHLCKLRIGPPIENINNRYNHLTVSNKHGLIFAVSSSVIKVVSLATLENISLTNVNVNDVVLEFAHDSIDVGVNIENICLNSDQTNLIIIYRDGNGLQLGAIDTAILNAQDKSNPIYTSLALGNSADGTFAKDMRRHPESPGIIAVCLSTGHTYTVELTDGVFNVIGSLTQGPVVCSVCWSPKGKQIVIGLSDGQLIQYDKTLKSQKKVTCCPEIFSDETKEVGGLFWISSYVFMVVYNLPDLSEPPAFFIVTTQKEGPPSFSKMDDIYFGFNEQRLLCYYFSYIPEWQLMITMASNAMEAVPVGVIESKWYRWGLQDTGRAEVPLNAEDSNDAFTVGTGICLNSKIGIKQDDKDLPPAPVFAMLTTDGVLCTYQMVSQFPNVNHKILTESVPIPKQLPKRGKGIPIQQCGLPNPATKPFLEIAPVAHESTNIAPSFIPPNKTITSAESQGSAFKFNFSGTVGIPGGTPAVTPVAGGEMKFTAPLHASSNPNMFSNPNPFNFTSNLGSGRGSPATSATSSQPSLSLSQPSKPLFNLTSSAPPFKNSGFSFNAPPIDHGSSPKPVAKPPVSIIGNTVPSKPVEPAFKPAEPPKFSFTPVVRPFETSSDPSKPLLQPVAQQQGIPVKPQVVSLANEGTPNFSHLTGTQNIQLPPQRNIASPSLVTPNKPPPIEKVISTPQTPGILKNEPSIDNSEIEQHAAQWNTTLQKNIREEINNFNVELEAFKKSCVGINCENLIGSREELAETKSDIALLVNHMDEYKGVMKENKSECSMLRENVLKNLKMLDEATLLKQKMEDKRYSNALKSRPLDPISARQRKGLRAHLNQVEQLLTSINVALDTKWEERMAHRRNMRNKTSSVVKRQQVYQTIDAIDQITNNLTCRLKKISLQSEENALLTMNLMRKSTSDYSTVKNSPNVSLSKTTSYNSPKKLMQLKSYLNNRGQTPVRRSKPYASHVMPRDGDTNLNPSFSTCPKASSTPFPAQNLIIPREPRSEKHILSSTLASIGNKSMTPSVLKDNHNTLGGLKVPENSPSTPLTGNSQVSKPSVQFDMPASDNITYEMVNKNLFGTPISIGTKPKVQSNFTSVHTPPPIISEESNKNTLSNPSFMGSAVDPKNFWGTSISNKPVVSEYTNVFSGEIPTGDSPEANEPEPFLSCPPSTVSCNLVSDSGATVMAASYPSEKSLAATEIKPEPDTSDDQVASASVSDDSGEKTADSDDSPIEVPKDIQSSIPAFEAPSKPISDVPPLKPLFGAPVSACFGHVSTITSSVGLFSGKSFGTATTSAGLFGGTTIATANVPVGIGSGAAPTSVFGPQSSSNSILGTPSSTSSGLFSAITKSSSSDAALASSEKGLAISNLGASCGIPATTAPTTIGPSTVMSTAVSVAAVKTTTDAIAGLFSTSVSSSSGFSTAASSAAAGAAGATPAGGLFGSLGVSNTTSVIETTQNTPVTGGIFGTTVPTVSTVSTGLFSSAVTTGTVASGGLFGTSTTTASTPGLFGSVTTSAGSGGLFGGATTSAGSGGLFGATATSAGSGGLFGATTTSAGSGGIFGATATSAGPGGLFGAVATTTATGGIFGAATTPASSGGLFTATTSAPGGIFGTVPSTSASGGLFGASTTATSGGLFGTSTTTVASGGLFGAATTSKPGGLFGTTTTPASGGLFGATTATTAAPGGLFGTAATTSAGGGLFGAATSINAGGGLFGAASSAPATGGLFGATSTVPSSGGLFGTQSGLFKTPSTSAGGIFGGGSATSSFGSGGMFGSQPASTTSNIFASATATTAGAFGSSGFGSSAQPKEGGGFGGFGLGGGPVNDPNKNPFGAVASSTGSNPTNIFGSSSSASSFGQTATNAQIGSGTFSKGFGSGISSGGFGASSFGTPQASTAPAFGGAPAFGSPPAFGASPAFGGAPTFGTSPPAGTFGSGSTFGAGSTFGSASVFGGGSALPSFGSLAQTDTTPTFGSQPQQASFGFADVSNTPPAPSGQQFSSWR